MIGLSHHQTNIVMRQNFYLSDRLILSKLEELMSTHPQLDLVVLSTCNRIEFYSYNVTFEQLIACWSTWCSQEKSLLEQHCYYKQGNDVVLHLYRVACGLDSMIMGEHQILGQLKVAYGLTQQVKPLKNPMNRLFEHCFFTAKSIRTTFMQQLLSPSLPQRVVSFAKPHQHILLIGAGQTIQMVLKKLGQFFKGKITICNRTDAKAEELASFYGIDWQPYASLYSCVKKVDMIIIATASETPLLRASDFNPTQSCTILDLSVPSNYQFYS
jgi:glutamyl-tRNA reductase